MKTVYLLGGKINSGKNYVADKMAKILEDDGKTFDLMMFAKGVKEGCMKDFAKLAEYLNYLALEASKWGDCWMADELAISNDNWYENKTPITRLLLQIYGTEIFRRRVDNDWWVKKTAEEIKESDADVIIVTDFRFPNECTVLKELLGEEFKVVSIKVERRAEEENEMITNHASETALDDFKFDYEINNNEDGDGALMEFLCKILKDFR